MEPKISLDTLTEKLTEEVLHSLIEMFGIEDLLLQVQTLCENNRDAHRNDLATNEAIQWGKVADILKFTVAEVRRQTQRKLFTRKECSTIESPGAFTRTDDCSSIKEKTMALVGAVTRPTTLRTSGKT